MTAYAQQNESELVAAAQAGRYEAFEELVSRYEQRIYNLSMRILRHAQDAEDAAQTTFLQAVDHLSDYRGEASFGTWLMRIATNTALKVLRRKRGLPPTVPLISADDNELRAPLPQPELIADWRPSLLEVLEGRELRRVLDEAINGLEEKYRLVFVLRDVEGLCGRETAEALGITESSVKVRLMRARLMLRERLTEVFGDPARRYEPRHHAHEHRHSDHGAAS
ncbi:MAG: RNA polymerase sigma factor [bacterium]